MVQYKLNGKIIPKKSLRSFLNESYGLDIYSFSFLMQQNNITNLPTNNAVKIADKILSAAGTKKYFQVQDDFKKETENWKKEREQIVSNISTFEQQIDKYYQNFQLFDEKDNIETFLKENIKKIENINQKIILFEFKHLNIEKNNINNLLNENISKIEKIKIEKNIIENKIIAFEQNLKQISLETMGIEKKIETQKIISASKEQQNFLEENFKKEISEKIFKSENIINEIKNNVLPFTLEQIEKIEKEILEISFLENKQQMIDKIQSNLKMIELEKEKIVSEQENNKIKFKKFQENKIKNTNKFDNIETNENIIFEIKNLRENLEKLKKKKNETKSRINNLCGEKIKMEQKKSEKKYLGRIFDLFSFKNDEKIKKYIPALSIIIKNNLKIHVVKKMEDSKEILNISKKNRSYFVIWCSDRIESLSTHSFNRLLLIQQQAKKEFGDKVFIPLVDFIDIKEGIDKTVLMKAFSGEVIGLIIYLLFFFNYYFFIF